MQVDISKFVAKNEVVAVALSGGSDSMALLNYMLSTSEKFGFFVVALNVEHGIRGKDSISDSQFVEDYCNTRSIPLLKYSVDSLKKAKGDKLSIEHAARELRYQCFYDAVNSGKCSKVATAHHLDDNAESLLFNLFRGTGIKGVSAIKENYKDIIIRPFLTVKKDEINEYVKENDIPFVTDKTNFDQDYTRNYLRLNVIPKIKEVFPEMAKSLLRLSLIAAEEDEFLDEQAKNAITFYGDNVSINLPLHKALFSRAVILALKSLGVYKDYEKVHIDDAYALSQKESGSAINLPKNVIAEREYDKIVFYKKPEENRLALPFSLGEKTFNGWTLNIERLPSKPIDLKSGLFVDADKIPSSAVIRTRLDGDLFTKFGGGTKPLAEHLSDKKIPLRERNFIPVLADGSTVLAVFSLAISDKIKIDDNTKTFITLKAEKNNGCDD